MYIYTKLLKMYTQNYTEISTLTLLYMLKKYAINMSVQMKLH